MVDDAGVKSVTQEEEPLLAMYLGHTSRAISKRAEALGWSAKEAGLDKAITKDVDVIVESLQA